MASKKHPLVSVIIAAFNEEKVIARLLRSIKNQSYTPIEIIVVDDSSTDDTAKISKKFTKNVFTRSHQERSIQRNFGGKLAKGKYLLFLDADMELNKNVIKECVDKSEKNKKIGAVVIPEKSVASNFWEKVKAFERSFYNQQGDEDTDAARFFTKNAYLRARGYDETLTGPEDWDLPDSIVEAGFLKTRINSYIFHYERIKSLWSVARKKYYYALTSHRYFAKRKIKVVGAKTVYFLRPVFYKQWPKLVSNPGLTLAMMCMLACETTLGFIGFVKGKLLNL